MSNVTAMRTGFRSVLSITNNVHFCVSSARQYSKKEIKRFYKNVSIAKADGGYEVMLDKYKLKTPMGKVFHVQSEALAIAVATEWDAQQQFIKKPTMYLTSLSNTAIDNPMSRTKQTLVNSIIEFLDTDTICYRVTEPEELVELQHARWDPLIDRLQQRYNVELPVTSGFAVLCIPDTSREVFRQHLNSFNDWALVGYLQAVDCLKSFAIATSVINREISVEEAVALARLEQEFQISQWGNVEWHHDVDKMELQCRLASAALFVYANTHDARTVFSKSAADSPV